MGAAAKPQRGGPASIAREASREAAGAAHAADHADRWALEITRMAEARPHRGLGVVAPAALRAAELAQRSAMVASEAGRRARLVAGDQGGRTRAEWLRALRLQVRVAARARKTAETAADEAETAVTSVLEAA